MLGLEKVPCIIADDLTPEQIRAFRLADNKVGELAEWDFAKLEEELVSIADMFDMAAMGFEEIAYNHIEDLLHDDDAMSYGATEKDTFNITFTFPLEHKDAVSDYVSKNGKEYIANMIVDIATGVKEWE